MKCDVNREREKKQRNTSESVHEMENFGGEEAYSGITL